MSDNWISVKDQLPEAERRVLAFYTNRVGNKRIEIAQYIPPKTIRSDDFFIEYLEDADAQEYDEENDCFWVVEGWWEASWESEENWKLSSEVTHWQPLPEVPKPKEGEIK